MGVEVFGPVNDLAVREFKFIITGMGLLVDVDCDTSLVVVTSSYLSPFFRHQEAKADKAATPTNKLKTIFFFFILFFSFSYYKHILTLLKNNTIIRMVDF